MRLALQKKKWLVDSVSVVSVFGLFSIETEALPVCVDSDLGGSSLGVLTSLIVTSLSLNRHHSTYFENLYIPLLFHPKHSKSTASIDYLHPNAQGTNFNPGFPISFHVFASSFHFILCYALEHGHIHTISFSSTFHRVIAFSQSGIHRTLIYLLCIADNPVSLLVILVLSPTV